MRSTTLPLLVCIVMAGLAACSSSNASRPDVAINDGSGESDGAGGWTGGGGSGGFPGGMPDSGGPSDGSADAILTCSYPDGGAPADGGTFQGVCPVGGCPNGTVCVVEVGGIAGGGGEYCAPIPNECQSTPSCACMAACVCTNGFGRPEMCSDGPGVIACDNGIR